MATTAVRWHIHFRNNSSSITDHLGRRAKLVPSLQVENRRLDREFHVLCPTKFGSSGVSTQPPESPAATVPSSWQKALEGCLSFSRSISHPWLPHWFYNFQIPAKTLQRMPRIQTSIFKIPTHFDEHILFPSFSGNCQHEVEHKTILASLHSDWDPAPVNLRSLAGSWYFILVLSWHCFSVRKRLSSPSFSSSLLCCSRWCSHFKSEFLIQQGCSSSCDTLEPLTPDFGLLNCWFIFAMNRFKIIWNLLQFIARQSTFLDKE